MNAGMRIPAGLGSSTIYADMDFETYSEAGYVWNDAAKKWEGPPTASGTSKGLSVVGAANYAAHPSTEPLMLAYDLKDGQGRRQWLPGGEPPYDLWAHLMDGEPIEAHNCGFERWIWQKVCVERWGWPPIAMDQWRCSMAKARAFGMPGALANLGAVLGIEHQKDPRGDALIRKFCVPRKPTKYDPRRRILVEDDFEGTHFKLYNVTDIIAESEASAELPDLTGDELAFWQADQTINYRGVAVDMDFIRGSVAIVEQAEVRYGQELSRLTGGIDSASKLQQIVGWLAGRGVRVESLDEEGVTAALARTDLPDDAREVLLIRQRVGSASVKKVKALYNVATSAGRVHDLFNYHAARTGRATGEGPQPQNLPNSGPNVNQCVECERYLGLHRTDCPHCGNTALLEVEWEHHLGAMEEAIQTAAMGSLEYMEYIWGDAYAAISGSLRGAFVAAPGHELLVADYNAIEAVVMAGLAGETWRTEVFNTHGKIYEMSASQITGIAFEEFAAHKARTGSHHPMRKKVGKIAELALGYKGWINAWLAFDDSGTYSEEEIKRLILAWRAKSPMIEEFWGGQHRGFGYNKRDELFGLEGMAVRALLYPHEWHEYRQIAYRFDGSILYCRLPSGRLLHYQRARLIPGRFSQYAIEFEGWNTNPKYGARGWVAIETHGGKLAENVVQAVARDILRDAILRLEAAAYPVVLHVHDEIVCEVPEGTGSVEEMELIMCTVAPWARGWGVKAAGGFRTKRFHK